MQISKRHKLFFAAAIALIVLVLSVFYFINFKDENREIVVEKIQLPIPQIKYGMVVNDLNVDEKTVKRNQLFLDLLKENFVDLKILQQLNTLPRKVFDFRKIASSKKYAIISKKDSLNTAIALIYEPNPVEYIVFHLRDSLMIEACEREVTTAEKSITGVIESSLYETIEAMSISPELTNKFVDVFGWQVDFQHLQKGDRFKLIYEENLVEGIPYSIGNILGIYFEHMSSPYYAFPFDQGEGIDFFDEEGKSLRKALLKYPIEFTHISSRYSMNRFHPVVKVWRPHLGTDFAAATGTPIRTVGDGIIEEAGYSSGNGNYVKVRHNGTYTTGYLHMSRIGSGIHAGVRVKQGQNIGYVGSTGLATGPHLCYRFWKNGVQVDALRVELPPSQPVKESSRTEFAIVKEKLTTRLNAIPFTNAQSINPVAAR